MPSDLTNYAHAGYSGATNQNIYSSPAYYAHELGAHLQQSGRPEPRAVRMSRGDSIRANDMLFKFKGDRTGLTFERVK